VLELLVSVIAMMSLRFGPRLAWVYWTQFSLGRRHDRRRTIIVGAGAAGEMLFRDLQRSGDHAYQVMGFVDDDRSKWADVINGRPVFGGVAALPELITRLKISNVLIAVPRESQSVARDVVSRCAGLKVQIKALPVSFLYFQELGAAAMLHDLSAEDLLSRQSVVFDEHERSLIAGHRILVTGAAGSIGSEICRQLLDLGAGQVLAVDINENGLYFLEQQIVRNTPADRFVTQLADIRDGTRIDRLLHTYRPHAVFHAAAHKHVPMMEAAPCEAVKNNVIGTRHVLRAAARHDVARFVFISTDKAVEPTSVMGATKRVGEIMTRAISEESKLCGCAVRFGNVLGSDGSVVPLFRKQIEAGGPVTITHPDVRRYFMTIPEAVGLVLKTAYGPYGDLCVLNMGEPIRILDLAHQMIAMAGLVPDVDIPIVVTGLRPGEKLTEELVTGDEEVVLHAEGKIQVVTGPPPPAGLWQTIDRLGDAAAREDTAETLRLLHQLVPAYQRPRAPRASAVAS
jgi:FlaA1/EpsC-like NDP-sugar epimerase